MARGGVWGGCAGCSHKEEGCHRLAEQPEQPLQEAEELKVALVGNANVGKSVTFGYLTGRYTTVSNYPGTTVTVTRGRGRPGLQVLDIVDTPGIGSLLPMSEDELVARDVLLQEAPDVVLQVADAKNLHRTILILSQLSELGLPTVLQLNLMDEAANAGMDIDVDRLQEMLGIPVIPTVATEGKGMKELAEALPRGRPVNPLVRYSEGVEGLLAELAGIVEPVFCWSGISPRGAAVMLASGDDALWEWWEGEAGSEAAGRFRDAVDSFEFGSAAKLAEQLHASRQKAATEMVRDTLTRRPPKVGARRMAAGRLLTHPFWGSLSFIGVLFLMYLFVGYLGAQVLVDFMEMTLFGSWVNPAVTQLLEATVPVDLVNRLIVGEYGLLTMGLTYAVAIVLPIVGTFFLAFSFLEDSGYIPRLAVMANRIFRWMGLSGKAILPMVLGLGCDTMATLTARTLETRKERVITTLLLALGIPCSAQLGVIFGLVAFASPTAIYFVFGVVALQMLLVGYLAGKILPGEVGDFILEVPPLRIPRMRNLFSKTLMRVEWFLREAVPLFLVGTLAIFVLDETGMLQLMIEGARPIVTTALGLPGDTTVAFILGFLRRDYGAAGLYDMASAGNLAPYQIVVSAIVMTLFVPCIANFLVIVKERGKWVAAGMVGFIFPFAVVVGAAVNQLLAWTGWYH